MIDERLYMPSVLRTVMKRHHLRFTKSLGQNFLIDGNAVRKIVETAGITAEDTVLEVGPGIGTLTQALLETGAYVITVELDRTFYPVLEEAFGDNPRFSLLKGDALKLPLEEELERLAPAAAVHVVANVPYYITTPLLRRFLDDALPVETITVLVQNEVADRMTAAPGTKTYGALSLLLALYGKATKAFMVPRTSFLPPPKVDSAVVHLKKDPLGNLTATQRDAVNAIVRQAFLERRKMVKKSLMHSTGADAQAIESFLISCGLPKTARAENLSPEDFVALWQTFGYKDERK